MFATRSMRLEVEVLKWVALMVLAMALVVLAASLARGGLPNEPLRLPADMMESAKPMSAEELLPIDPNEQLWKILAAHRSGDAQEALLGWELVELPRETDVWRHVARGMALLQLGEIERAALALSKAEELQPDQPVVHYAMAILRLEQARTAREWYDAIGPMVVRLATFGPREVVPNSKSMYQLAAMMEFEKALELADNLERTLVLVMPDHRVQATVALVTVGDLLEAIGADRYEGQTHNMLGMMYVERANGEAAEQHLDAAVKQGANVVYGYRDLAALYELQDRHGDAFRVHLKSLGRDPSLVRPMYKALENAAKAVLEE
jgi:tetratricopeptide (TPR) repeat protein